ILPRSRTFSLFPYTTLFRSRRMKCQKIFLASLFHDLAPICCYRAASKKRGVRSPSKNADHLWPDQRDLPFEVRSACGCFVFFRRSEEHTSELQSPDHLVCRL